MGWMYEDLEMEHSLLWVEGIGNRVISEVRRKLHPPTNIVQYALPWIEDCKVFEKLVRRY